MLIDPIIFIFLTASTAILTVILLAIVISYAANLSKFHRVQQINFQLQAELSQKPLRLLEDAHGKALEIISQANKQANEILSNSELYKQESQASLKEKMDSLEKNQQDAFHKASQELQEAYKIILNQVKEEDINTLKNITKDIESDAVSEFKEFTNALEKETINAEKIAKKEIDEEYLLLKKELDTYKQEQLQKVDEDIYSVLYRVSELVLSEGISFDHHKQLVIEALDQAKKEQVFK